MIRGVVNYKTVKEREGGGAQGPHLVQRVVQGLHQQQGHDDLLLNLAAVYGKGADHLGLAGEAEQFPVALGVQLTHEGARLQVLQQGVVEHVQHLGV